MKAISLRLSIGVSFALVGIFLGLFATANPLNDATIRRSNDATDRQHGPFPTIQLQQVASGFKSPVTVTNASDGSGRLFIVQQPGQILILINGTILPTPFLDISDLVSCCGEQGLLGLAFHPDYATNGFFYVDYTDNAGNTVVARYTVSARDPNVADPDSAYTILTQAQPFPNHNGGQLAFGPDGYLYIALGDGGSGGDPQENGQNLQTWLGKILRVDINSDGFPGDLDRNYAVPPDNPFVGNPDALDEIWAYGVRNPWRFSFDRETGDLFIADVGQNSWEEIDFQPAASTGGENYGWDVLEGIHCFEDQPPGSCNQFLNGGSTLPVLEYSHSLGCSVTGGYRYRGQLYPQLDGIYFYSDLCSGTIWGAIQDNGKWVSQDLLASGLTVTTFGEDESGEVYVADYSGGTLYQLISEGPTPTPTTSPSPTITPTSTPTATPTVTPMATPTTTPSSTPTSTPTATPTSTPTPTATATASPTATPRPTPTPRSRATPRPRPSPPPRPGATHDAIAGTTGTPRPRPTPVPRPSMTPFPTPTPPTVVDVTVGPGSAFTPSTVYIPQGGIVRWTSAGSGHSVTSGVLCTVDGQFCSPNDMNCQAGTLSNAGTVYEHTFTQPGAYPYFCFAHCSSGLTGAVIVVPPPPPGPRPTPAPRP